jgi:hypothetical protein
MVTIDNHKYKCLLLGIEIYRGNWHCEDKKSLKMGKTIHFQTLVFPEKKIPSIMAGTNLEGKS